MASFEITVNTTDIEQYLDALGDDAIKAARPAAQAAAQVLYQGVLANVARLGRNSGNLHSSIYQVYSRKNSNARQGNATYHISWNARKAPHGHLVENGYIQKYKVYMADGIWYTNKKAPLAQPRQVAAHPFVRPALALKDVALTAAEDVFIATLLKRGA